MSSIASLGASDGTVVRRLWPGGVMCAGCIQSGLSVAESVGLEPSTTKAISIATVAVMLFSLSAQLVPASTSVRAGAICTKPNQKVVKSDKTFVCKKSGKNFVWQVQKKMNSTSTSSPNPNPQPQPVAFSDNYQTKVSQLDTCRLKETRNFTGAGPKGFPMRSKVPHLGKVKMALIPVDFANSPGVGNPGEMFADDLTEIKEWSNFFSRGKMTYDPYLVSKNWLRAPKGAEYYVCVRCQKGASSERQPMEEGFKELVALADPIFDFTDTKFVYFIFPYEAEAKYGTSMYFERVNIETGEGRYEVSAYGEMAGHTQQPNDRSWIWPHVIHEILHFQGWIGHGPFFDTSIMTGDFGASQAVTSWEAFLADWFAEPEIICIDQSKLTDPTYITMDPIDSMGTKPVSVMVKISDEELLIVELRRDGKYSNFTSSRNWGGALTGLNNFTSYFVNVNETYMRADWKDLGSTKPNFWKYVREDNKIGITKAINYKGITLEVTNSSQIKLSTK